MPKCDRCWAVMAPDFLFERKDGGKECIFCRIGKNEIQLKQGKKYTKEECIKDYELFLKKIKEVPDLAKFLTKSKE